MAKPTKKKSPINCKVAKFLNSKNSRFIEDVVKDISNQNLTPTSHLYPYKKYDGKTLQKAAILSAKTYTKTAKNCPPLALIDVVLSSGRSYNNIVKDSISSMRKS